MRKGLTVCRARTRHPTHIGMHPVLGGVVIQYLVNLIGSYIGLLYRILKPAVEPSGRL
jgi:hypothetical protein